MIKHTKEWFDSIKWDEPCQECRRLHNGNCPDIECAKRVYDEWGDPIPLYLYHDDCNDVEKYLEEKRKRMI